MLINRSRVLLSVFFFWTSSGSFYQLVWEWIFTAYDCELKEPIDLLSRLMLDWIVMSQYLLCIQLISQPWLQALFFLVLNKHTAVVHSHLRGVGLINWPGVIKIARITVQNKHRKSVSIGVLHVARWHFMQCGAAAHRVLESCIYEWCSGTTLLFIVDRMRLGIDPRNTSPVACRNLNGALIVSVFSGLSQLSQLMLSNFLRQLDCTRLHIWNYAPSSPIQTVLIKSEYDWQTSFLEGEEVVTAAKV